MRSLRAALTAIPEIQIVGTHRVGAMRVNEHAFDYADILFVNGEGSIHHDNPRANFLLDLMGRAKSNGKRVLLVNALFQQYVYTDQRVLSDLALLTLREPRSAAFAKRFGGDDARALLDSAADPAFLGSGTAYAVTSDLVIGGFHPSGLLVDPFEGLNGMQLTLSEHKYEDIVATLEEAEVYVTGQHHGLYAAALAGCPVVTTPSNSHKIEAFVEWTGLPIPVCMRKTEIESAIEFARRNQTMFSELKAMVREGKVLSVLDIRYALGLD